MGWLETKRIITRHSFSYNCLSFSMSMGQQFWVLVRLEDGKYRGYTKSKQWMVWLRQYWSHYRKSNPIVDPVRLTLILSNPTQPWVISNLTPCLVVITIKIYGLILKIFLILQCLFVNSLTVWTRSATKISNLMPKMQ